MATPAEEFEALLRGEHPDDRPFADAAEASDFMRQLLDPLRARPDKDHATEA